MKPLLLLLSVIFLSEQLALAQVDVTVTKDEFTGRTTIMMKEETILNPLFGSTKVVILPALVDTTLLFRIGFMASEWLFLKRVSFKIDTTVLQSQEFEPVRQVIKNGILRGAGFNVSEVATFPMKKETLRKMGECEKLKIRLWGDSKYVDAEVDEDVREKLKSFYLEYVTKSMAPQVQQDSTEQMKQTTK